MTSFPLQTDAALMYDGVLSFCHGLKSFDASHEIRPANVSCDREQSWPDGLSLLNYINSVCHHFQSIMSLFLEDPPKFGVRF